MSIAAGEPARRERELAEPEDDRVLETTVSLCPECRNRVPATLVRRRGSVYLVKQCPHHGRQTELREANADYYESRTAFDKPGTASVVQTAVRRGCPFDCGLCPDHRQHTCIGLIEINEACELECPECYTGGRTGPALSVDQAARMMDAFVAAENGHAEVLQISGGEPTLHPQLIDVLKQAKARPIQYVLLNTNGLRLAEDRRLVSELAALMPHLEVYQQFDGMESSSHLALRGRDLHRQKLQAVENLTAQGIPVTLVATVRKHANDHEIGAILRYATRTPGVRGVNFQPLALFRAAPAPVRAGRITLTEILQAIERQTGGEYRFSDFVPLPCNVERVALTFCYRERDRLVPITRHVDVREHLSVIDNTFAFNADEYLARAGDPAAALCGCMRAFLARLRPIIPADLGARSVPERVTHFNRNVFRISVSSFVDLYDFDLKSMQRECVHVITPDLRRIPFSAYNLFHRPA